MPNKIINSGLAGCSLILCSCANIETHRAARLNQHEGSIYLLVSGRNTSLITAEGPFPEWSNDLEIFLKEGNKIPTEGKQTYIAGEDFSTSYNEVQSGTVLIDHEAQQVDVNLKYTKQYAWNRVNGRFLIKNEKR